MWDYKKRSGYEIMIDILEVSLNGANKTRIVYSAYLNFKQAKQYIEHLKEAKLIRESLMVVKRFIRPQRKGERCFPNTRISRT